MDGWMQRMASHVISADYTVTASNKCTTVIGITHEKTHLELQREPVVAAIPGGRRCTASTIAAVRHDDDQSLWRRLMSSAAVLWLAKVPRHTRGCRQPIEKYPS